MEYQGIAQTCRDAIRKAKAQLKLKLAGNMKDKKSILSEEEKHEHTVGLRPS